MILINKQVEIKDLEEGDEIIIGAGSKLKYLKILKLPKEKGINSWNGKMMYGTAKCSGSFEIKTYTHNYGNRTKTTVRKYPKCTPNDHNLVIYENLNHKSIFLVVRHTNKLI